MSTRNEAQAIADSFLALGFLTQCCTVSAFVIAVYDQCLLLEEEVRFVWRRKMSLMTILYGVLRLMTLMSNISSVALTCITSCEIGYLTSIANTAFLVILMLDNAGASAAVT